MSWDIYTEEPEDVEPTYSALLPSVLKDVWDGREEIAGSPAPTMSHVNFQGDLLRPPPTHGPYVGSAPPPSFGTVLERPVGSERNPMVRGVTLFYSVSFHPNRTQILSSSSEFHAGDFVITDADRGIDIGRIVAIAERPPPRERKNVKAIVRLATESEIAQMSRKREKERNALLLCQAKVRELGLPMEITGAEFQFDGKKLTFYYAASRYVDFRTLVRTLFKLFGTRIWMVWYDGTAPVKDVLTRGE